MSHHISVWQHHSHLGVPDHSGLYVVYGYCHCVLATIEWGEDLETLHAWENCPDNCSDMLIHASAAVLDTKGSLQHQYSVTDL